MPPPLLDRIALVTGASRGIGYATALALAKAGAHVVALARTVGGLEELDDAIKSFGATATLVPLDLKDYAGIDRLGLALHERFGRLDVLVDRHHLLPRPCLDVVERRKRSENAGIANENIESPETLVQGEAEPINAGILGPL